MKRSKFTDVQILAIVKEGEALRKVAHMCRRTDSFSVSRSPSIRNSIHGSIRQYCETSQRGEVTLLRPV
jgi:hypothetical protein